MKGLNSKCSPTYLPASLCFIIYKGKCFGQKFQYFPHRKLKHANFFPVFSHQHWLKSLWYRANCTKHWKLFNFSREFAQKKLHMTRSTKNIWIFHIKLCNKREYLKTWNQGEMKLRRIGRDRLNFLSPCFSVALISWVFISCRLDFMSPWFRVSRF